MSVAGYEVLDESQLSSLHNPTHDFALDVLRGLSGKPKRLPSKYFYDDVGSEHFRTIMSLEEYYPTDCEREILEAYADNMLASAGTDPINLVDLGAGDGAKTKLLLQALEQRGADFTYVPIDISGGAMKSLVSHMREELPRIQIAGLVCDYTAGLSWLRSQENGRRSFVLFLGSNLGNFNYVQARAFLRRMWLALAPGDLVLVGFDMKKDIEVLLRAYNDSQGVTAKFNLNILERINRELGGTFDISRFRHYGTYDVFSGAMVSYLVSREPQQVWIEALSQHFAFDAWEPIHTEYSYKYLPTDIERLASDTGFLIEKQFSDEKNWFVDSLWRVSQGSKLDAVAP